MSDKKDYHKLVKSYEAEFPERIREYHEAGFNFIKGFFFPKSFSRLD